MSIKILEINQHHTTCRSTKNLENTWNSTWSTQFSATSFVYHRMVPLLFVICLGPVCIPIWGLLPILFTLFPSLRKYVVGEHSPAWLRTCLCLKKDAATTTAAPRIPLSSERTTELDQLMETNVTLIPIQSSSEYDYLLHTLIHTYQRNVVVQWTASWCKPCVAMQPVVAALSKSTKHRITFIKCDLDLLQSLSQECNIAAVPTFQGFGGSTSSEKDEKKNTLLFSVVGKKEQELLSAVAKCVEQQLRGKLSSRLETTEKVGSSSSSSSSSSSDSSTIQEEPAAEKDWRQEKDQLLAHHTLATGKTGWKISQVQSAFPFNDDRTGSGVKLEVILCSGEICTKKIYRVYKNGKVL